MWSAIGKVTGAVGNVFSGSEQPPYDCAWPPKEVDLSKAQQLADEHHKQANQLHNDPQWTLHSFKDPEGADMKLFTRPMIGRYHFLKATFSIPNATAQQFIDLVGSSDLNKRQTFSSDCVGLERLDQPAQDVELVHAKYWAPPPVAQRDFVFLISNRDNKDGSHDLWGCTVAHKSAPEGSYMQCVRGASLFCWKLIEAGDMLLVSYVNCFDPRGWTPGFLLQWMKTTAAKEFCAIRAVMQGKEVKVEKVDLSECGVSADEVEAEIKTHEDEVKGEKASK